MAMSVSRGWFCGDGQLACVRLLVVGSGGVFMSGTGQGAEVGGRFFDGLVLEC